MEVPAEPESLSSGHTSKSPAASLSSSRDKTLTRDDMPAVVEPTTGDEASETYQQQPAVNSQTEPDKTADANPAAEKDSSETVEPQHAVESQQVPQSVLGQGETIDPEVAELSTGSASASQEDRNAATKTQEGPEPSPTAEEDLSSMTGHQKRRRDKIAGLADGSIPFEPKPVNPKVAEPLIDLASASQEGGNAATETQEDREPSSAAEKDTSSMNENQRRKQRQKQKREERKNGSIPDVETPRPSSPAQEQPSTAAEGDLPSTDRDQRGPEDLKRNQETTDATTQQEQNDLAAPPTEKQPSPKVDLDWSALDRNPSGLGLSRWADINYDAKKDTLPKPHTGKRPNTLQQFQWSHKGKGAERKQKILPNPSAKKQPVSGAEVDRSSTNKVQQPPKTAEQSQLAHKDEERPGIPLKPSAEKQPVSGAEVSRSSTNSGQHRFETGMNHSQWANNDDTKEQSAKAKSPGQHGFKTGMNHSQWADSDDPKEQSAKSKPPVMNRPGPAADKDTPRKDKAPQTETKGVQKPGSTQQSRKDDNSTGDTQPDKAQQSEEDDSSSDDTDFSGAEGQLGSTAAKDMPVFTGNKTQIRAQYKAWKRAHPSQKNANNRISGAEVDRPILPEGEESTRRRRRHDKQAREDFDPDQQKQFELKKLALAERQAMNKVFREQQAVEKELRENAAKDGKKAQTSQDAGNSTKDAQPAQAEDRPGRAVGGNMLVSSRSDSQSTQADGKKSGRKRAPRNRPDKGERDSWDQQQWDEYNLRQDDIKRRQEDNKARKERNQANLDKATEDKARREERQKANREKTAQEQAKREEEKKKKEAEDRETARLRAAASNGPRLSTPNRNQAQGPGHRQANDPAGIQPPAFNHWQATSPAGPQSPAFNNQQQRGRGDRGGRGRGHNEEANDPERARLHAQSPTGPRGAAANDQQQGGRGDRGGRWGPARGFGGGYGYRGGRGGYGGGNGRS